MMQDWFQTNIFKIKCLLWRWLFVKSERFLNYSLPLKCSCLFSLPDIKLSTVMKERCLKCPRLLPIGQMRWCHRLFLTVACFSLSASNTSSEPKVRLSERGSRDKANTVQHCVFISVCRFCKQRDDKLIKYHQSVYVESIFWKHETQKMSRSTKAKLFVGKEPIKWTNKGRSTTKTEGNEAQVR